MKRDQHPHVCMNIGCKNKFTNSHAQGEWRCWTCKENVRRVKGKEYMALKRGSIKCAWCKILFKRPKSTAKFCSKQCAGKDLYAKITS